MLEKLYKIESITGRVYIGQSIDINRRWRGYINGVDKRQRLLFNSFNKHGVNNHHFSILHELSSDVSKVVIDNYEKLYITAFKDAGFQMLNVADGGIGGRMPDYVYKKNGDRLRGGKLSDDHKKKISHANSGKIRTDDQRLKISIFRSGTTMSDEQKRKISLKLKGRVSPNKGKSNSPETIEIKRQNRTGKKHSEETKKKISEANYRRWAKIKQQ